MCVSLGTTHTIINRPICFYIKNHRVQPKPHKRRFCSRCSLVLPGRPQSVLGIVPALFSDFRRDQSDREDPQVLFLPWPPHSHGADPKCSFPSANWKQEYELCLSQGCGSDPNEEMCVKSLVTIQSLCTHREAGALTFANKGFLQKYTYRADGGRTRKHLGRRPNGIIQKVPAQLWVPHLNATLSQGRVGKYLTTSSSLEGEKSLSCWVDQFPWCAYC